MKAVSGHQHTQTIPDHFAFAGVRRSGEGGMPVLTEASANFECETLSQQEAGDHRLFIGQVLQFHDGGAAPLVFQAGHYWQQGDRL